MRASVGSGHHVAKLYNVAAGRIATEIVDTLDGVINAECLLVSRGQPVTEPQAAHVALNTEEGVPEDAFSEEISDIIHTQLEGIRRLWEESVTGGLEVF